MKTPPFTPRGRGCCQCGAAGPPGASVGTCFVALWSTSPGCGAGKRAGSTVGTKINQNAHRPKHTPHTLRKRSRGRLSPGTRAWFFESCVAKSHFQFIFCAFIALFFFPFQLEYENEKGENGGGRRWGLVALSVAQPQPDGGRELFWARCHYTLAMAAPVAGRRLSSRALQPDSTGLSCLSVCAVPCFGQTRGGAYGDMPGCD